MADIDKNILIIPNKGQTSEPTMTFTGQVNDPITLRVLNDNTLSFEGSAGQLFSISPSLTGTIFSVNDISGIPSIEVDDTGEVRIAEFSGNVGIGKANPAYKLDVNGVVRATSFIGDIAGNASTASSLATARTISLTGAVTGSVSFNGSSNVSITTTHTADPTITLTGDVTGSGTMTNLGNVSIAATVADDSHNHIISNVDGLQTALDGKQPTGSYLTTATTFDGDVSGTYNAIVVANDSHTHTATTLPPTMPPSAHTLDSHSNVTISSIASGEILKWNGTAWENNTLGEAGIQPAGSYLTTATSFGGDVSGTYNAIVVANDSHTHSFSNLTSKPTTLAGYGITDAIPKVSTAVTGNIPEFNSTGILVDSGIRIEDIATGGGYAILNRYSTTLSSSSTTVTFNITNFESQTDALIVYENLVYYLEPGVDYTLTNNTTITLLNGAKRAGTKYDFIAIANVPEELGTYSGIYIAGGTIDNSKIVSGYSLASDAQVTNWNAAYTHKSSNGTDHSYINQSVTTSATPQFAKIGLGAAASDSLLRLYTNSTGEVPSGLLSLENAGAGEAAIRFSSGSTTTNSWYLGLNQGDAFKLGYNASATGFTDATIKLAVTTAGAVTATSFNSITGLASSAPSNLATTASVGTSTLVARQDHVHKLPTLGDLGYSGDANANYYTHPTTEGNKHIPSGGVSGNILRWSSAGTAAWGADTNTWRGINDTPVDGATTESISSNWAFDHNAGTGNGKHVPAAGNAGQFLAYNGDWATPPNTTYTSADFDHNSLTNTHNLSSDLTPAWGNVTDKPTFATVATSGSYADLSNKPAANAFTSGEVTNLRAGKLDDGTTPWTNASNLSSGTIASSLLPPLAITSTYVVATEAAQIALDAEEGDVAVRTDLKRSYIHNSGTAGTIADWTELQTPTDSVLSVNGETGTVSLSAGDVGALASNHPASGVTTTKIDNWDAAYTHAGTTHYAEPGIFSGGGTPTLATGVTGAEIIDLIGASASHTHPYLSDSSTSTQSGYFGNIYLKDDTNASHYLIITDAEDLTANRTLSLDVDNADRTLRISGDAVISGTNTGDQTVGNATLTLAAGTGVTLSATPSFTANATTDKTITITNSSPNVTTDISITHNATTVVVNSSDGNDGTINGATSTTAGVVTNAAQTWAGVKTFNSAPVSANGYTTGSATMVYNSTSKTIDFVFV